MRLQNFTSRVAQRPVFLLVPLVLFSLVYLKYRRDYSLAYPHEAQDIAPKNLHVGIINVQRYHFEVVLPLLYTFSRQRHVSKLEFVADRKQMTRHGAEPFIQGISAPYFDPLTIHSAKKVQKDAAWNPDVIVLTSCKADLDGHVEVRHAIERTLQKNLHSNLICILHEVTEWNAEDSEHRKFIQKWAPSGRVKFMVLSEHVKKSLEPYRSKWGMDEIPIMDPLVPVFPLNDSDIGFDPKQPQDTDLGVPGKYELFRRSYQPLFKTIDEHTPDFAPHNVSIHLVGFGDHPEPPEGLKGRVQYHDHLLFKDYWCTLRRTLAIPPSFANEHYVTDKASSTVPTALIVSVPLIVDRKVLHAYTYLTEEAVWLLDDEESVGSGFARVLRKDQTVWAAKRQAISRERERLEKGNIERIDRYLGTLVVKAIG